jgi:hypothetical protein
MQKKMSRTPLQDISNPVARQLAEGKPLDEIVQQLVERGWRVDIARRYVEHLNRKYDLEHGDERTAGSVIRTLTVRALYAIVLIIVSGTICAIGLAIPPSVLGLILFAVGVIVLSLGMVFILLK